MDAIPTHPPTSARNALALPGSTLHWIEGPAGALALHQPVNEGARAGLATGPSIDPGSISSQDSSPHQRPLVLLVHSINAAACAAEMQPLFERLQGECRVFALDLPGYGASDRPSRAYDMTLFVRAIEAAVEDISLAHEGAGVHVVALSLSCEFAARLARRRPERILSLGLISPTGLDRRSDSLRGLEGASREVPGLLAVLSLPLLRDALFAALVTRGSMRYFLRRTWGSSQIDEGLLQACWLSAHQPNAVHAPLSFLSGRLFSRDIRTVYEALQCPVWMAHGTRGDFRDYSGSAWTQLRPNWRTEVFEAGALPHFEHPEKLVRSYLQFLHS